MIINQQAFNLVAVSTKKRREFRFSNGTRFDIYIFTINRERRERNINGTFIKQGYRVAESTTCMNFWCWHKHGTLQEFQTTPTDAAYESLMRPRSRVQNRSLLRWLETQPFLSSLLIIVPIDERDKNREREKGWIGSPISLNLAVSLRNTHKVKRILYEHPVFCGVTRVHAPRRSPVYMNKRTQARRQWTEHYSALQETSAWCIDRGWPHVIEWVTSHSFQRESYVTLGCILRGASTKIFPSPPSPQK